ncbi:hypothetical protein [Mucilaginibacter sp.]|uniref:hypothetical protein n=1 Tax=Mucilaginibacter sp. TaxID=1882438 RepID=UPI0025F0D0E1|nr:hypothetical protein [Mucilaginibacter sp.]
MIKTIVCFIVLLPFTCFGQSSIATRALTPVDEIQAANYYRHANNASFSADSIIKKIDRYNAINNKGLFYLHLDKTVYTNNEDVWFTAYLLNSADKEKHHTLSVALVNDDDRKIAMEELFAITNSLSFGHLTLPDTIPPGNYHLLAYSNVLDKNGKPTDVFSQPIAIKTTGEAGFSSSLRLVDTVRDDTGNLKAIIRVENKNPKIKPIANIEYALGQKINNAKTDIYGEYAITIPKTAGNLLRVAIKQGKDLQFLSLNLPIIKGSPVIRFFPEGGNMVEGISNLIGWEARSSTGEYLKLSGVLYKNDKPADTIQTNYYGIGKFKFAPQKNCRYTFRLIKSGSFINQKDTIYNLPQALPYGPVMHITNVLAEDTLNIQLKSTKSQTVILLVHNYQNIIAYKELTAIPAGTTVKILLNEAPKGLATVTLLDSMGQPLAERLFFAHYKQKTTISLETDRAEYGTREKVNLKLKLNNTDGLLTHGLVSVACVQDNRIESTRQSDIDTYVYLKHDLQQLPADPLGKNYANPDYVQDLLLVKGWRRYTWTDLVKTTANDTLNNDSSARFLGNVTIAGKLLKKAAVMTVVKGDNLLTINTNSKGKFDLTPQSMVISPDKKITLMVAGKFPDIYTIDVNNPYKKINIDLAGQLLIEQRKLSKETNTQMQVLNGFEKAIALKEVIIKDHNDDFIDGIKWHKANEKGICNDYVCVFGYLNCPIHSLLTPGSFKPFIGGHYKVSNSRFEIIYKGCILFAKDYNANEKYKLSIKGINQVKEYYPIDATLLSNPEPEYLSNIYWNYGIKIDSNNEVDLSFYTGDITGRFKVIIQGADEKEVWSKQLNFTVKKKITP